MKKKFISRGLQSNKYRMTQGEFTRPPMPVCSYVLRIPYLLDCKPPLNVSRAKQC